MKIAVTGANSSVGQNLLTHVINQNEFSIIAGVRSQRAAATLPKSAQIDPQVICYDNVSELAEKIKGASCLVHLAGILMESKGSNYASANVDATAAVVAAAQQAKVKHFVFISVVGANRDSANTYFRSKAEAEDIVAQSGLSASIIRTSILLGPETAGASAIKWAASQPKAKLLGGGNYSMNPLDVDDLSLAILNCCKAQQPGVSIHELVGPEAIQYRDLIKQCATLMGKEVHIGSIPIWFAKLGAAISRRIKGGGMSPTVIDVITTDEVVEKNANHELGINSTSLSATLEKILVAN